jgi:hypothetical protein
MIIKKPFACETCGTERSFKFNTNTNKVYLYKALCQKCTLTLRNKTQNFAPRKHKIVDPFETIDTQEKAYIFGFLWADGCLNIKPRKNKTSLKSLSMILHPKDKEVIEFIIKHFGGSYTESTYFDKRTNKDYDRITWQLNSFEVYDNFKALNFREDSSAIPDHLFPHFLRGVIDGDGCFYTRDTRLEMFITSSYSQDWSYITDRIQFPYNIKLSDYGNQKSSVLYFLGDKKLILDYIYKDSSFSLQRKKNKIIDILNV